MKDKKFITRIIIKVLISLACIAVLCVASYVALIISIFSGEEFYTILVVGYFFLLLTLIPVSIFGLFRRRALGILWLVVMGGIVIAVVTKESIRAYHNSFERISDTEVDLTAYQPFEPNTLAVSLDTISTLKLDTLLPRIDGATALYPIYASFAQAVYPEKEYPVRYSDSEVSCHTTPEAYNALIANRADIIFVLHPSQEQLAYAEERNIQMKLTPIGKEAFVFFVNAQSPISNLTTTQLREIYSGRIKNWKDVGGKDEKIKAFQRQVNSGSQTAIIRFMDGQEIMTPPQEDISYGMGEIIDRTSNYANYPNAIGYSFRFYTHRMVGNGSIKILSVDGVYPDKETIQNGSYPLTAEFYAVTREGETNPNVQLLLDWILSEQGQYIVEKTGYNGIGR